ncbi:ArsR family transcriptional regulator [Citricoccus sp. SGAir0253]|uniref:helix-turn-helix domain-containing protein n=1 Tax=Citricoccus sp. SGAir0253 TaxID=2567881 RepID=UPI0010CD049D|nr:helix-turn-helix domain-containing protein [Citricoccus sp. SGAir0253]QCU79186.1 ArsR family transcriptional regulator [Citricoccus sp. SGAir0253]
MAGTPRTADVVLHPVRLRIIQSLLGGRELTTAQIAAELDDVSTATLYRHVATLAEAGILEVVDEQRVRGAVERTYGLHAPAADLSADEVAGMSPEEHRVAFVAFLAGLLSSFERYLERPDVDLARDGVGYRHLALWLTDAELGELLAEVGDLVRARAGNGPGEGRVRRLLSAVLVPGGEE